MTPPAKVSLTTGTVMVVPTYQEAANVPPLVQRIEAARRDVAVDVLVVDDNSPDGTAAEVRRLAATRPWLHLLERAEPMGLGSAYRDGFAWALMHDYGYVGEMDADLSHEPAFIPALHRAVMDGADLALGSRYVSGGGTEGWPWKRRMLSRGANLYARTLLGLKVRDVTGGFRLYSRRAVERIVAASTECAGYGFQVEAVHVLARAGLPMTEVPITFRDRTYGDSKMTLRTAREAAARCVVLALTRSRPMPELHLETTDNGGIV